MQAPLKPLIINSSNAQLDPKQKKFQANVTKALERFDSVTEWADYIASLGTLLKTLQSWSPKFPNVKYHVPSPYQVSRRLTSSLSPNLPAGVHQKTLEVYTYIFENIGIETLASECNIWIPGILPLMSFASMSVKSHLIELYETYLVCLPSRTLKIVIRPLLASLFPGIDDESSEFLPMCLKLIESLRDNLADDSLFWQTCFLIMITDKDRRLGGLVWLTRKLPALNAVPHLLASQKENLQSAVSSTTNSETSKSVDNTIDRRRQRDMTLAVLLPAAKDVVTPEPGLLTRCLIRCLDDDNDILIKRNALDLLLQRFHLSSPVFQILMSEEDRKKLILKCCKTMLNKDMSFNRRIWNWFLGPTLESDAASIRMTGDRDNGSEYFTKYGLQLLLSSLFDLLHDEESLIVAFQICLAFMDRWEIGSLIIPEMFTPLLVAAMKFRENSQILRTANTFFDTVETNIIWGKVFIHTIEHKDISVLKFVLSNFHVSNEEEIIVRHLPLILLALSSFIKCNNDPDLKFSEEELYDTLLQVLLYIPERAFLPLYDSKYHLSANSNGNDENSTVDEILNYYKKVSSSAQSHDSDPFAEQSLPYTTADLTFLIFKNIYSLVLENLDQGKLINKTINLFISLFEKIPERVPDTERPTDDISGKSEADQSSGSTVSTDLSWDNSALIDRIFDATKKIKVEDNTNSILGITNLYSRYLISKMELLESMKLLNLITHSLWDYMVNSNSQPVTIKCLKLLERHAPADHVASALSKCFMKEKEIPKRFKVVHLIWHHLDLNTRLLETPLQITLDELFDELNPGYLTASKWIYSIITSGTSGRLYGILTQSLLNFDFFEKSELAEFDDMDSFTYRVQVLTKVLRTNDNLVLKNFNKELTLINDAERWKNVDVSTYKSLTVVILLNFLQLNNNTYPNSVRAVLELLTTLLDGSEFNFEDVVVALFQISTKYISNGSPVSQVIAASLLDTISKLLHLAYERGIRLTIFSDDSPRMKFVDFMVLNLPGLHDFVLISTYSKLLSESIAYFDKSLFQVILPLTTALVQCINRLFELERANGGYFYPISLLLGNTEELLEVTHSSLLSEEKDSYFSTHNSKGGDFLQSMVSNVFYSDTSDGVVKVQAERDVVSQVIKLVSACCLDIWQWAHNTSGPVVSDGDQREVANFELYKFRARTNKILEKMFSLEPLEILEIIINTNSKDLLVMIHVLDGNKPSTTMPYLFYGVVLRYNKNGLLRLPFFTGRGGGTRTWKIESSMLEKLSGSDLMKFLTLYSKSLENAAVEEFYRDFITFFKDVTTNYNLYKPIYLEIIEFVGVVGKKLSKSQMGYQGAPQRREISDMLVKYIPNVITEVPEGREDEELMFTQLEEFLRNLPSVVSDGMSDDKLATILSPIINQCLVPKLRAKDSSFDIPNYILTLSLELTRLGSKVKIWKSLVYEIFTDDKRFLMLGKNKLWEQIIYQWSQYPEYKTKLLNELLLDTGVKRAGVTPALMTLTPWNDSDAEKRCQNLLRIAYLLLISPLDTFMLDFQPLISCVCQYLLSSDVKIKSCCWILLRTMLLKFTENQFNDFWSMISYCLQTNLQEFYESLQIQSEIDVDNVLQICKTLDLLLMLNLEGFSATNEWIFIIDTINCIYRNNSFISLVDKIAELKEVEAARSDSIELTKSDSKNVPLLYGVHNLERYTNLSGFFHSLSYEHYEAVYSLRKVDLEKCEEDAINDIFR